MAPEEFERKLDREKVIEGLKHCLHYNGSCLDCPYDGPNCQNDVLDDAIVLLKEYEPKKVISRYANWNFELIGNCPKCNAILHEFDNAKACGVCGQAVKWE